MNTLRALVLAGTASFFVLAACSSSSDSGSATASSCQQAKSVADSCNSQPSDGGASIKVTFDEAKCEQAGDQGKKIADCIVANKTKCDCLASCSLTGACQ